MVQSGKFGVKRLIQTSGTLGVFDITSDTQIRLITENAGATNTIAVYGRIQGQNSFALIDTVVGNTTKLIDVALYDFLDLEVITYDSLGNYVDLAGSGFKVSSGGTSGGNVNVTNFPNPQNVNVVNIPTVNTNVVAGNPVILNMALGIAGVEYSLVLPDGTKKFSLNAVGATIVITFGWVSGGPVITIPKGCSYTVEGVSLTGANRTIYLKTNTNGTTIEILSWV
jgi:hypothetical protein